MVSVAVSALVNTLMFADFNTPPALGGDQGDAPGRRGRRFGGWTLSKFFSPLSANHIVMRLKRVMRDYPPDSYV